MSNSQRQNVPKPKTFDEVWSGVAAVFNDALRNLDGGVARTRFAAAYT
jgi:hypothetical protein